jgi:serine/threonine-protein kinase
MTEGPPGQPPDAVTPEARPAGAEKPPGTIVAGKYLLVRRLASGGMGDVYEAQHLVLGRRVALKFIRPELAGSEPLLRRFRREAETAGRLVSDHITSVTDFDWARSGEPYLVMELLEGWDLAQVLRSSPLPAGTVAEIGRQVCRGLAVAHARGFVHRDLKPANLFLCRRPDGIVQVKILDFGIAKNAREPAGLDQTRPGDAVGTAHYMAPEQIRQSPALDGRADLYSLGVVLYEALTGTRPRRGDSYYSVVLHGLNETPAPIETGEVPAGLAEVVMRALAHAPEDRFPSAQELERALAPFAAGPIAVTWQAGATKPTATASSAQPAPVAPTPRQRPRPARGRWMVTGATAALVASALVLVGRGAHWRGSKAPPVAAAPGPAAVALPPPPAPSREQAPAPAPQPRPEPRDEAPRPRRTRRLATHARPPQPGPARASEPAAGGFVRENPYH